MELVFDYMKNDTLRHQLNALTQKIYGFDFESWMAGGYFEAIISRIPLCRMEESWQMFQ